MLATTILISSAAVFEPAADAGSAAPVAAQASPYRNPVSLTEIQRLARLPENEQRRDTNQRRILTWFLYNVEYFQSQRQTIIERAGGVVLGPRVWPTQEAPARTVLVPPFGTGNHYLIFNPGRANPATMGNALTGAVWWEFPIPDNDFGGNADTCWEEMQHVLLGANQALTQGLDTGLWFPHLKFPQGNDQADREHVFIEYAKETKVWLDKLDDFEKEAAKAYGEAVRVWKEGVRIDREAEHYLWRSAAQKWEGLWYSNVWDRRTRREKLIPLTPDLRRGYQRAAQVWLPTPDQVRIFYMNGGITDDADPVRNKGNPIKIPEWVMRMPMRSRLVNIVHAPATPTPKLEPADPAHARPERLAYHLQIRVLDQYSPVDAIFQAGRTNPVMRGKLTIYIRQPIDVEPETGLAVSILGKSYPIGRVRDGRQGLTINLRAAYRDHFGYNPGSNADYLDLLKTTPKVLEPAIVFHRDNPRSVGRRQYQIAVLYQDADDTLGPALYEDAEAVFTVTFEGSTTSGSTQSGVKSPGQTTTTILPGPHWVLSREWGDDRSPKAVKPPVVQQNSTLGRVEITDQLRVQAAANSRFSYVHTYIYSTEKIRRSGTALTGMKVDGGRYEVVSSRTHTWTVPPPMLAVGQRLPFQLAVETAGSRSQIAPPEANTPERKAFYDRQAFAEGSSRAWMQLVDPTASPNASGAVRIVGQLTATAGTPAQRAEFVVPAPETTRKGLDIVIYSEKASAQAGYVHTFRYEWKTGAADASPCTFERVPEKQRNEHTEIDNVPDDVEEKPPPEPPVVGVGSRWYTHPSGDWRIRISQAWRLKEGGGITGDDMLEPPNIPYRMFVRRDYQRFAGAAESALTINEKMLIDGARTGQTQRLTLGPAAVGEVSFREAPGRPAIWMFLIAHQGRLYTVRIEGGVSSEQPLAVLRTIEFLRRRPDSEKAGAADTETAVGAEQIHFAGSTWAWSDPKTDATWRVSGASLTISAMRGNDLWPAYNFDAPRVTQRIRGDFTLEVRVRAQWREGYNGAGLIVEAGPRSVVRLERGFRGIVDGPHIGFLGVLNGREVGIAHIPFTASDLYLRIEREGTRFTGYASVDGSEWSRVGMIEAAFPPEVGAGVALVNEHNAGRFSAAFSNLRLNRRAAY